MNKTNRDVNQPDPPRPPVSGRPPSPRAARIARGRFAELNGFIDVTMRTLKPSEVAVWLILFRDTKAATGTARTGQTDIARRAGITTRAVRKALTGLVAAGVVKVVRRGRVGAGPSVYKVRGINPAKGE